MRGFAPPIWGPTMAIDGALLEIEDLNAWYGESHVLHGVTFDVREGETISLIGRNGAGKTTTLRAILGIVRNRKGVIRFRGEDLTKVALHAIARRGIGYVPEERGIFASLTVAENLVLPPVVKNGGMSVEEIYNLFPNLAERRSGQGTKLSGGEQQMLAIARILRTGADVILLDEPTEGLAPVIVQRIGEVLQMLKTRGMTIVLVEQNFHFARKLADRYVVIENGRAIDHFAASGLDAKMAGLAEQLGV
ncbi:amino acid/amide ABC transporter ATP-binding protein 2, HAAT family [Rhizobiales bacterium GAS191]|nr:amino acid/amide ABC transporter ATP-binding protein 2, HAAT family [Rhizobiales bacterium GAS113]SEE54317.1 amino acid/amide ABC transporter ATP-binding protein 2, HAAT family [Rhizobiales bacterium GAS191]